MNPQPGRFWITCRAYVSFTVRLTLRAWPRASTSLTRIVAVTCLPCATARLILANAAAETFLAPFGLSFSVALGRRRPSWSRA